MTDYQNDRWITLLSPLVTAIVRYITARIERMV